MACRTPHTPLTNHGHAVCPFVSVRECTTGHDGAYAIAANVQGTTMQLVSFYENYGGLTENCVRIAQGRWTK